MLTRHCDVQPRVYRSRKADNVGLGVSAGTWGSLGAGAGVWGFLAVHDSTARTFWAAFGLLFLAGGGTGVLAAIRSNVLTVDDAGLHLRWMCGTKHIPWWQVRRFETVPSGMYGSGTRVVVILRTNRMVGLGDIGNFSALPEAERFALGLLQLQRAQPHSTAAPGLPVWQSGMDENGVRRRVYRTSARDRTFAVVRGGVLVALGIGAGIGAAAASVLSNYLTVFCVILTVLGGLNLFRAARPDTLAIDDTGLTVREMLRTKYIPWSDVRSFGTMPGTKGSFRAVIMLRANGTVGLGDIGNFRSLEDARRFAIQLVKIQRALPANIALPEPPVWQSGMDDAPGPGQPAQPPTQGQPPAQAQHFGDVNQFLSGRAGLPPNDADPRHKS